MSDETEDLIYDMNWVEKHLYQSEKKIAPNDFQNRLGARSKIYSLIQRKFSSDAEIARVVNELSDTRIVHQISENEIGLIREIKANLNVSFCKYEPIDSASLISIALHIIFNNCTVKKWPSHLIVATDWSYRPHASITPSACGGFIILISRHLLFDMQGVSAIISDVIADVAESQKNFELDAIFNSNSFFDSFKSGIHKKQMPYLLASIASCEKYRFVHQLKNSNSAYSIHPHLNILCIVFLLSHEIAHILNGDFDGTSDEFLDKIDFDERLIAFARESMVEEFDEQEIDEFWEIFEERYLVELKADFTAMQITLDAAVDVLKNRNIGVIASVLALLVIDWMDRATFYFHTKQDPAKLVGKKKYNQIMFGADCGLYQKLENWDERDHPFGKSRAMAIGYYAFVWSRLAPDTTDHSFIKLMGEKIGLLFVSSTPEAMIILDWINARDVDYLAVGIDDEVLKTTMWPDPHERPHLKFHQHTRYDEFYGFGGVLVE